MKKYILKSCFITILSVVLFGNSNLYAQEKDLVEIHLKKAGKLSSELKKLGNYVNLKISGPINGSDFVALKEYCSSDLEMLDLTDALITPGGKVLFKSGKLKYKIVKENVLCNFILSGFKYLEVLVLPRSIVGIEEFALAYSPNISVIYFSGLTPSNNLSLSVHRSALNCNKILVPGDRYYTYKQLLPGTYTNKIFKGDAPSEYNIHVSSNHRLLSELEGGFDFVKKLTISGELNNIDLEVIKLLGNLEYLDLREAKIYDRRLEEDIDDYVDILVPKTEELLMLEEEYDKVERKKNIYINKIKNEINQIDSKKKELAEKKAKIDEEQMALAFTYLLFNMAENEAKQQNKRGEMNNLDYWVSSQYYSHFKGEIEKELENLDIADDESYNKLQNYYDEISKSLNDSINSSQTVLSCDNTLMVIDKELEPLMNEYVNQQIQMREYLKYNSSIPSYFLNNYHLKKVILPKNTVVIAQNALKGCPFDMKVIVDKNKLKIFDNIGISNWENVINPE